MIELTEKDLNGRLTSFFLEYVNQHAYFRTKCISKLYLTSRPQCKIKQSEYVPKVSANLARHVRTLREKGYVVKFSKNSYKIVEKPITEDALKTTRDLVFEYLDTHPNVNNQDLIAIFPDVSINHYKQRWRNARA